jgi:hypothetical protein
MADTGADTLVDNATVAELEGMDFLSWLASVCLLWISAASGHCALQVSGAVRRYPRQQPLAEISFLTASYRQ